MRNLFVSVCLLILGISLVCGCGKVSYPNAIDDAAYRFPLAVGNRWEYDIDNSVQNIRGDSAAVMQQLKMGMQGHVSIEITGEAVIDTFPAFAMQSAIIYNDIVNADTGAVLLNNLEDGLYILYSSNRLGFSLQKPHSGNYLVYNGTRYNSIAELNTALAPDLTGRLKVNTSEDLDEYYQVLAYPLAVGRTWQAQAIVGTSWTRTIENYHDVSTTAGTFPSFSIDILWERFMGPEDFTTPVRKDYYASPGLIKRYIKSEDIHIVNVANEILGVVDLVTTYELVDYTLE